MKNEIKFAYIAGLFDGEGTVTLSRNNSRDKYRAATVSMTSTSLEILEFLVKEFGGSICKQKVYKDIHKQSWSWRLTRRNAVCFLKSILPYMLEKEKIRRANLICNEYISVTPRNGKYSEKLKTAKLEFEKNFFHPSTS